MASDMQPVYDYIKSLLSMHPPDQKYKQKSEVRHFERKTKRAFAYAYDVTAFPDSSFIAVLHTDTEFLVRVEFGKEGFKGLIVVLDGNTVKGISNLRDDFKFTIPEESGKPYCIAVNDSKLIAISFPDKGTISLYDKQGQFKHELNAHSMRGVFTTSKDRFIYTTPKRIVSISDTGENIFSEETSSTPRSICCDNYGNIYVTLMTTKTSCGVDCFTKYGTHMGCVVENCGDPFDDITLMLTPSHNLIVATQKSVNIYEVPLPWGMFKCFDGECIVCTQHVKESSSFTRYETKKQHRIKSHISCISTNIIYVITCKKCCFQFFDYTNKPLEKQIVAHRKSVANAIKKNTKFVQHYKQEGHDMVIQGIESLVDKVGLGIRERHWIDTLQTKTLGLNVRLPRSKKTSALNNTNEAGMFKCTEDKCIFCEKHAKESTSFTCSFGAKAGENYNILSHITCTTKNVIYLITCKKCETQYVGQTEQHFKARMSGHRSTVNTSRIVVQHFMGEHSIEDMVVQGIESLGEKPKPTLIKERREFWNNELQMRKMNGLLSLIISED